MRKRLLKIDWIHVAMALAQVGERLPIARPLPTFDMAPTAGTNTSSRRSTNLRASQREPDRDASPMTRVAAVRVAVGNDDRKTYAGMLQTVTRRRRVDRAKVHRALALLARDLDLFVGSFNSRVKTVAQLTFHDAPDDLRVASIGRGEIKKKRSRRAGARVQRGRRNEAKRETGVKASPSPFFQANEAGCSDESRDGRRQEPPRKVSVVGKDKDESAGRFTEKRKKAPLLVVREGAVGASPLEAPSKEKRSRAIGAKPTEVAALLAKEEAVGQAPATEGERAGLGADVALLERANITQ